MKSSLPVARAFNECGSLMRHLVREPRVIHLRGPRRVHRRGYLLKAVALNPAQNEIDAGRSEKGSVVRFEKSIAFTHAHASSHLSVKTMR